MSTMTTDPTSRTTATGWSEIYPPLDKSFGATGQFFGLVAASSFLVYWIGSLNGKGESFLTVYLLVCPGALGLGWVVLWIVHGGYLATMRDRRVAKEVHAVFQERAQAYGPVHHLDSSITGDTFTGLALAGTSLLVVQDGQLRKLLRHEIRGWRWDVQGAAQFVGRGQVLDRLELQAKDRIAREKVNGIFVQTFDPARPELHFRTSSEEVCKRWEVILENIDSGRTVID